MDEAASVEPDAASASIGAAKMAAARRVAVTETTLVSATPCLTLSDENSAVFIGVLDTEVARDEALTASVVKLLKISNQKHLSSVFEAICS